MQPDSILTVDLPAPLKIRQNAGPELRIQITVADGYHVQANPASHDFLVPFELKLRPTGAVRVGQPLYPPAQPFHLAGMPDPLLTYAGTFEVRVPLQALSDALARTHRLRAAIRYQACDSRACLPPADVRFLVRVEVLESNEN